MKSIEQRIEDLKDCVKTASAPGNADASEYMWGMANGLICGLAVITEEDPKYLEKPSALTLPQAGSGWIPVTPETMPEDGQLVTFTARYAECDPDIIGGFYQKGETYDYFIDHSREQTYPTHKGHVRFWMPLPELPEGV
jgi:hypothetical protein